MITTISPYRVYSNNDPPFLRGTIEPLYFSLVDKLVQNFTGYVIELVVLILYVQNHMSPLRTVAHDYIYQLLYHKRRKLWQKWSRKKTRSLCSSFCGCHCPCLKTLCWFLNRIMSLALPGTAYCSSILMQKTE